LLPAIASVGCFEDPGSATTYSTTNSDETGDGDGDGDGDPGDGDGDPGDGDGVPGDGDGAPGDGDGAPGDGDGAPGDGDGDEPEPACGDGVASPGELCLSDTPEQTAVNQAALRIAVAEFDPGIMGVLVTGGEANSLAILRGDGNGNGALFAGAYVGIAAPATSIAAADLDGDGHIDFVAGGALFTVRRNDGNGGWGPVMTVEAGAFPSYRVVIGQIDGNAPLDIVFGEGYNTRWIRGSATNGWSPGTQGSIQLTGGDSWVVLTQFGFDGDNFTDLMVASRWSPLVSFARGMGNGTFVEQGQAPICNGNTCEIQELHAADVTGNDDPDIIASFESGFSVVPAKGDGTFDAFKLYASPGADHIASGDIDNDGDIDIVVASRTDGDLRLFLNDGTGTFGAPIVFAVPGQSTRSVAMADMNGDGALELVTAYNHDGSGWVAVFKANP